MQEVYAPDGTRKMWDRPLSPDEARRHEEEEGEYRHQLGERNRAQDAARRLTEQATT